MKLKDNGGAERNQSPGPYTCRSCCQPTWNDSDVCDECEDDSYVSEAIATILNAVVKGELK